jgi:hypothetical protein
MMRRTIFAKVRCEQGSATAGPVTHRNRILKASLRRSRSGRCAEELAVRRGLSLKKISPTLSIPGWLGRRHPPSYLANRDALLLPWQCHCGYTPAPTSPREVLDSRSRLPLHPAGDGLGRNIQRKPDILLGQRLAHRIALVVVPATGEREQLRFKIRKP